MMRGMADPEHEASTLVTLEREDAALDRAKKILGHDDFQDATGAMMRGALMNAYIELAMQHDLTEEEVIAEALSAFEVASSEEECDCPPTEPDPSAN